MVRVFVVGVGMTKVSPLPTWKSENCNFENQFEKPGKRGDDYPGFAKEAITKALDDAKVKISEVEVATCGYVYGN